MNKVLDFGLAKLVEKTPADAEEAETRMQIQTQAGMIMGTVAYMSPEQARGLRVDARTDIFSLGAVLYEMLTRRQPFTGETVNHTIVAILEKEPPSISQSGKDFPAEIERIVFKTLAKDRDKRYESAKDLLTDLKNLQKRLEFEAELERSSSPNKNAEAQTQIIKAANTANTETRNSIAVLPFANLSADEENEYFGDGLAEELLNALAKIEDLRVTARTSAFSFKGKNVEVSQIGNILNVKTILEGSVRKSGNKLRITVQLINAADGYHLWSERYDREMRDIFDVQDEITLAVVDALKVKLLGEEKAVVLKRYTDNTEAYEFYLKGLYHYNKYTPEGWNRAIEYFDKAIQIEPEYAAAFAGKALSQHYLYYYAFVSPNEIIEQWLKATSRALELDETVAEAHLSLANYYFYYERNRAKAEREFKRAIELNPNSADAHQFYGLFLASRERFDEGIREGKITLELDPLSLVVNFSVGWIYWFANRFDDTFQQVERMIEIEPNFFGAYWQMGTTLIAMEDYEAGIEALEKSLTLGETRMVLSFLGSAYGQAGKREEAFAIINQLLEMKKQHFVGAYSIARVYSGLGLMDETYEWLEKALAEHNGELVYLNVISKAGSGFQWGKYFETDSRFPDLMRRINSPTDDGDKSTNEASEARTAMLSPAATDNDAAVPTDMRKVSDFPPDDSKLTSGYAASVEAQPQEVESNVAERHSLSAHQTAQPLIESPSGKHSFAIKKYQRFLIIGLITFLLAAIGFSVWYFSKNPGKQIESIAVLPFENGSGNADLDYLSDGVSESVIDRLSQLPQLKVIARSSSFRYRGANLDLKQIADALGVQAIVTGRVAQRGDSYLIRVDVTDVRENKQLWGENFTRKASDIQILQTDISREIAENLRFRLSGTQMQQLASQGTTNPQAYELLLKGRYYFYKTEIENYHKAVEYYEQAVAADPNYALAYAELSTGYDLGGGRGLTREQRWIKREASARKALELDPNLADAHFAMAQVKIDNMEWAEGERESKRTIELNPNLSKGYSGYSRYLSMMGRHDEAIATATRGLQLSPFTLITNWTVADSYFRARQIDKAIEAYKKTIELNQNASVPHWKLGDAYVAKGMFEQAIAEYQEAIRSSSGEAPNVEALLGAAYAKAGMRAKAEEILKKLKGGGNDVAPRSLAILYAALGMRDEAFAQLEKAFATRSPFLPLIAVEPTYDNLRDDPRFQELLRKVGVPK